MLVTSTGRNGLKHLGLELIVVLFLVSGALGQHSPPPLLVRHPDLKTTEDD